MVILIQLQIASGKIPVFAENTWFDVVPSCHISQTLQAVRGPKLPPKSAAILDAIIIRALWTKSVPGRLERVTKKFAFCLGKITKILYIMTIVGDSCQKPFKHVLFHWHTYHQNMANVYRTCRCNHVAPRSKKSTDQLPVDMIQKPSPKLTAHP